MNSIFDTRKIAIAGPDDLWQRWIYIKGDTGRSVAHVIDIIVDPPTAAADELHPSTAGRLALIVRLADGRRRLIRTRVGVEVDLAAGHDVDQWLTEHRAFTLAQRRSVLLATPGAIVVAGIVLGAAFDAVLGTGLAWALVLVGASITTAVAVAAVAGREADAAINSAMALTYTPMIADHLLAVHPAAENETAAVPMTGDREAPAGDPTLHTIEQDI